MPKKRYVVQGTIPISIGTYICTYFITKSKIIHILKKYTYFITGLKKVIHSKLTGRSEGKLKHTHTHTHSYICY